jgi:hypothetical protein
MLEISHTQVCNGKMQPVETVPGMWGGRIKENDGV